MLQILIAISQKFCCKKEALGYAKVINKKERKNNEEKLDTKVSEILKTMGT